MIIYWCYSELTTLISITVVIIFIIPLIPRMPKIEGPKDTFSTLTPNTFLVATGPPQKQEGGKGRKGGKEEGKKGRKGRRNEAPILRWTELLTIGTRADSPVTSNLPYHAGALCQLQSPKASWYHNTFGFARQGRKVLNQESTLHLAKSSNCFFLHPPSNALSHFQGIWGLESTLRLGQEERGPQASATFTQPPA